MINRLLERIELITVVMIVLAGLAACSGSSGGSDIAINNDSGVRIANIRYGQVFSKADDIDANSELVNVDLELVGNDVPDDSEIMVTVQGALTVGGRSEAGFARKIGVMNGKTCTMNILLFPGDNVINVYQVPEDALRAILDKNGRLIKAGDIRTTSLIPSTTVSVTSTYQSVGDDLSQLISEAQYNQITADARNKEDCRESNRVALGLPDMINGQWYYTYENFINAMRKVPRFAGEGDLNTRKLEIAAFFANVAQETGSGGQFGVGCAIQEGYGVRWDDPEFGGLAPTGAGYAGRGPLQLSWDYNYKAFGEDMGDGDAYLNDPDILTKDPTVGLAGSMWFWNQMAPQWNGSLDPPFKPAAHDVMAHLWEPTVNDTAAGRTLERDFGVVINIINGGIECSPGAGGSAAAQNRVNYYRAYAAILGAVIPATQTDTELNCANQGKFDICPSSLLFPPCE